MFCDRKKDINLKDFDTINELCDSLDGICSFYSTLKESLDNAYQFGLDQSILDDFEGRIEYIKMIIKPYSIENIKSYFHSLYQQANKISNKKYNVQKNLGLSEKFYNVYDVEEFFSSPLTLEEFLSNIITDFHYINCDFFSSHLIESMRNRTTANCVSDSLFSFVSDTIISVIREYSKLYDSLSNKNRKVAKISFVESILVNEEIEKAVLLIADTNIIRELLDDVNQAYSFARRVNTCFYLKLPLELREKLYTEMKTSGAGEIYSRMLRFYEDKEVLLSDEMIEVEREKDEIDEEIAKFYSVIMRAFRILEKNRIKEEIKSEHDLRKSFSKILQLFK